MKYLFLVISFISFGCVLDITKDIGATGTVIIVNNGMAATNITKIGFRLESISDFNLDKEDYLKGDIIINGNSRSYKIAQGKYVVIAKTVNTGIYSDNYSSTITVKNDQTITVNRSNFGINANW
jgi:hypothetical protein